jgi:cytoskeletal protein CcmA (bactofilin family)
MDPSKLQSDSENDVHSLEGTGTVMEDGKEAAKEDEQAAGQAVNAVSDATGGKNPDQQSAKPPFFKRIWQKFNIYLLLFILVVIIAIGVSIVMFVKNKNSTTSSKDVIDTQSLSDEALKQLANTSVNVGSSKQVLNIESNSIFAGAVLVRSDLEVAGTVKVGRELQLPGISVTGDSRFTDLQADNLGIAGSATVNGILTASKGLSVNGNSTFNGNLSAAQISTNSLLLNGELTLTRHVNAGGPTPDLSRGSALGAGGTASVSGSDTSGSITINTGSGPGAGCFATVTFATRYNGTPHVIVTPIGSGAAALNYYVNRSTSQFSVCTTNSAPSGQTFGFDYVVLG